LLNFKLPDSFADTLCSKGYKCVKDITEANEALNLLPTELLMRCFLAVSNRCNDIANTIQRFLYDKSVNADVLPEEDQFCSMMLKKGNFIDLIDTVEILEDAGKRY